MLRERPNNSDRQISQEGIFAPLLPILVLLMRCTRVHSIIVDNENNGITENQTSLSLVHGHGIRI